MITASEIQETLRDLIAQFGPPNDSNSRMYCSLLKNALANDPREAGLLELSIAQNIPIRLFAQKENPQIIDQLVQDLQTTQQINGHAAEWIVKTWAKSMGMNVPSYQSPVQHGVPTPNSGYTQQQSYQPPVFTPPVQQGTPTPNTWNDPQQTYQPPVNTPPVQQGVYQQSNVSYSMNNGGGGKTCQPPINNPPVYQQKESSNTWSSYQNDKPPSSNLSSVLSVADQRYLIIIIAGGLISLISLFLPAGTVTVAGIPSTFPIAFTDSILILYLILIISVLAGAVFEFINEKFPYPIFFLGIILLFITIILEILMIIGTNSANNDSSGMAVIFKAVGKNMVEFSIAYGFFLEIIGSILVTVGGYFDYYSKKKISIPVAFKQYVNAINRRNMRTNIADDMK